MSFSSTRKILYYFLSLSLLPPSLFVCQSCHRSINIEWTYFKAVTISGFHRVSAYVRNISCHTAPEYTISCTRWGLWFPYQASTGVCTFQNYLRLVQWDMVPVRCRLWHRILEWPVTLKTVSVNFHAHANKILPCYANYCPRVTSELQFTLLPGNHCNRLETHDTPIQGQISDDAAAAKDFCESINKSKFLSCMKKKLNYGKWNCIRVNNEFGSSFPSSV